MLPSAILASDKEVGSLQLLLVEESKKPPSNGQKAAENCFKCDQICLPPRIEPTTVALKGKWLDHQTLPPPVFLLW
jgi:hypothetical protein